MNSAAFCIFLGSSIFGAAGWWIGNFFGFVPALIVSTVLSFVGMWAGWKFDRDHFSY